MLVEAWNARDAFPSSWILLLCDSSGFFFSSFLSVLYCSFRAAPFRTCLTHSLHFWRLRGLCSEMCPARRPLAAVDLCQNAGSKSPPTNKWDWMLQLWEITGFFFSPIFFRWHSELIAAKNKLTPPVLRRDKPFTMHASLSQQRAALCLCKNEHNIREE